MYIRWFELNVLNTTKLLKISDIYNFSHIYQLKLIPPTGYFNKIWGNGIVCNNKNIRLNNGITGQTGFTNASGHVDVVYNGKAAGGEHGAVYYYNEGAHTLIWKYGGFRK